MEEYFKDFQGREDGLRAITRYSLYSKMRYRTNLWTHSRRVSWIVEALVPAAKSAWGDSFDGPRAMLLALVHDDPELIIGDIQAGNKSKMTPEQLATINSAERDAMRALAERFPKRVGPYSYEDLLNEAFDKRTPEALVANWADKVDAFGEALHELYGGNASFATNVVNEYGTIPLPTDYYLAFFAGYKNTFPLSIRFLEEHSDFIPTSSPPVPSALVQHALPHTAESVRVPTGYGPYDAWRFVTLTQGTEEDRENLVRVKEV